MLKGGLLSVKMIEFQFIEHYAPIWIFLVSFILIYACLKLFKLPGNNPVLAILSFLISLMLISSTDVVEYIFNLLPFLTTLLVVAFFLLLMLVFFVSDKWNPFKNPIAWVVFAIAIIIIIFVALNHFSTLNHMLPNSSDSGLSDSLEELKDWMYSDQIKNSFILIVSVAIVGFFLLKK